MPLKLFFQEGEHRGICCLRGLDSLSGQNPFRNNVSMWHTCDVHVIFCCSHDKTEELEEQKEALERDYAVKMERLREELMEERDKDRAKYLQEIEALRQRNLYTPPSDCMDDSDYDPRRSSTYDLLQSVAFSSSPIRPTTHRDIAERIVEGKEEDRRSHTPNFSQSYPDKTSSYPPSATMAMTSTPSSDFKRSPVAVHRNSSHVSIVENEGHLFRLDSQGEESNGFCVVSELNEGHSDTDGVERDGDSG